MNRLSGKRAFITAAGQGVGRAIAEAFVIEGAVVTATDRDATRLAGLGGAMVAGLDVTDADALRHAITEAAPDILVNCAETAPSGSIAEATDADFDRAMDINVRAQFHAMQAVLPGMVARGGGAILNIGSVISSIVGARGRFLYGMSKAAVIGMTKSVAADYTSRRIRVNAICPGTLGNPALPEGGPALGRYGAARSHQPGNPQEIAALALYLASDEAGFTTGQAHVIDGGWAMS
ncbi:MAG: SDR family oxidoreductase [Qingshengfaniella sp.]